MPPHDVSSHRAVGKARSHRAHVEEARALKEQGPEAGWRAPEQSLRDTQAGGHPEEHIAQHLRLFLFYFARCGWSRKQLRLVVHVLLFIVCLLLPAQEKQTHKLRAMF